MAVNKRRMRNQKPLNISTALRNYFEFGITDNKTEEDADLFLLLGDSAKVRAEWDRCKEEILTDWKRRGEKGLPWAAKEFDNG